MRQITDLENRIRKLQRDHRDCVEGNQILRAARGSSVRLSAPDFIALLKELDRFGNATVPCVGKKKRKKSLHSHRRSRWEGGTRGGMRVCSSLALRPIYSGYWN